MIVNCSGQNCSVQNHSISAFDRHLDRIVEIEVGKRYDDFFEAIDLRNRQRLHFFLLKVLNEEFGGREALILGLDMVILVGFLVRMRLSKIGKVLKFMTEKKKNLYSLTFRDLFP